MARISPDPAKPASRSSKVIYIIAVVCLVQFGVIGGWLATSYLNIDPFGTHTPAASTEKKEEADTLEELKPGEVPTLARGDGLLQEGRYDLALKVYDPLASSASGTLRDAL